MGTLEVRTSCMILQNRETFQCDTFYVLQPQEMMSNSSVRRYYKIYHLYVQGGAAVFGPSDSEPDQERVGVAIQTF